MHCQGNFNALTLAPIKESSGIIREEEHASDYKKLLHTTCCGKLDPEEALSAVVLADYPYRLSAATESFAGALGFKASELTKSSLRVAFGPQTDLHQLKRALGKGTENAISICFYKRNGDELQCSITSQVTYLSDTEPVATMTIVSLESGSLDMVSTSEETGVCQHVMPSFPGCSGNSICDDTALKVHLSAIRRSRKSFQDQ